MSFLKMLRAAATKLGMTSSEAAKLGDDEESARALLSRREFGLVLGLGAVAFSFPKVFRAPMNTDEVLIRLLDDAGKEISYPGYAPAIAQRAASYRVPELLLPPLRSKLDLTFKKLHVEAEQFTMGTMTLLDKPVRFGQHSLRDPDDSSPTVAGFLVEDNRGNLVVEGLMFPNVAAGPGVTPMINSIRTQIEVDGAIDDPAEFMRIAERDSLKPTLKTTLGIAPASVLIDRPVPADFGEKVRARMAQKLREYEALVARRLAEQSDELDEENFFPIATGR